MNLFEHIIEPLQDVRIPEAKYSEPLALEEFRPPRIRVLPFGMVTAIDLDDKPTLDATEIGNERWNRVLPAKFGARALSCTQTPPQLTFGIGLVATEATRM